jgi:WD domain, G-beta repeat
MDENERCRCRDRRRQDPAPQSEGERLRRAVRAHHPVRAHRPDAHRRPASPTPRVGRVRTSLQRLAPASLPRPDPAPKPSTRSPIPPNTGSPVDRSSQARSTSTNGPRRPNKRGTLATGHTNWIYRVAFSPDGTTLVTASRDHSVHIADVTDSRLALCACSYRLGPRVPPSCCGPRCWRHRRVVSDCGQQRSVRGHSEGVDEAA